MSTGAEQSKQAPNGGKPDPSGGNLVGGDGVKARLHQPPAFMGQSGKPDNQSTSRGKGTT
jgi:hypothetical protein